MGRRVDFAASALDEDLFLEFLRGSADIQLFRSFADTEEQLWVEQLAPFGPTETHYYVWNMKYAWKPKFRRSLNEEKVYIEDKLHGSVLHFTRTNLACFLAKDLDVGAYGGVYWAKYNRQRGFLLWFESIVRWIRQTGLNLRPGGNSAVYCLPDALRLWRTRTSVAKPDAPP